MTHFAVALKYVAADMAAPRLVAKGADEVAFHPLGSVLHVLGFLAAVTKTIKLSTGVLIAACGSLPMAFVAGFHAVPGVAEVDLHLDPAGVAEHDSHGETLHHRGQGSRGQGSRGQGSSNSPVLTSRSATSSGASPPRPRPASSPSTSSPSATGPWAPAPWREGRWFGRFCLR